MNLWGISCSQKFVSALFFYSGEEKKNDRQIAEFVAFDMWPVNIMEGKGFKELMRPSFQVNNPLPFNLDNPITYFIFHLILFIIYSHILL